MNGSAQGNVKRAAGGGLAGSLVVVAVFLWPEVNGRPWTPEVVASMTVIVTVVGGWLGQWLPNPPRRTLAILLPLLLLGGCSQGRLDGYLGSVACDSGDAGGQSDCTALKDKGSSIYIEGGSGSFDPKSRIVTWAEATLVQVVHGPAVVTTVAGQDAIGESIRVLTDGVVKLGTMIVEEDRDLPPPGPDSASRDDDEERAPRPETIADR